MLRVAVASLLVLLSALAGFTSAGPLNVLSRADPARPSGTAGGTSEPAGVSSDGRYTLFLQDAVNLLPGVEDANTGRDVFFHDRVAGTTVLVSHAAGDPFTTGNGISDAAALSADGRWVAYRSFATDLMAGQADSPGTPDMFLWDRDTGAVSLISHKAGLPTTAAGLSFFTPDISADGSGIVYISTAPDLVAGQVENPVSYVDAFLYDRATGANSLVSHRRESVLNAAGEASQPVISADGKWVAFVCSSDDVVGGQDDAHMPSVFLYEKATGANRMVSHAADDPVHSPDDRSRDPRISANGGRISYLSLATDLVTGQVDANGAFDVFLYDRVANASRLVSRTASSNKTAGSGTSLLTVPTLNANGRYVAFSSGSSDLVADDFNQVPDVFLYDFSSGKNVLVSRSVSGLTGDSISHEARLSSDGGWVAFLSKAGNLVADQIDGTPFSDDLFLWSRATGAVTLVSHAAGSARTAANGVSTAFHISSDGSWIAAAGYASDLVAGVDDANAARDLFLYERATGGHALLTARGGAASATSGGLTPPGATAMSNDGRLVAFTSAAPNLVPGLVDGNNASDVFLHDRITGANVLVSHAAGSSGTAGNAGSRNPLVTADGSALVFESDASDLAPGQPAELRRQLFLYDLASGEIAHVNRPASPAGGGGIWGAGHYSASGDGRWIAFADFSASLVPGQVDFNGNGDVFLFDRATGASTLVSHASGSPGQAANGSSSAPAISADGRWVVFVSSAANLVPGQVDTNGALDVFLWDRISGSTALVSRSLLSPATTGNGRSDLGTSSFTPPVISAEGRWIVFGSYATDLVPGQSDSNFGPDVFLFDRLAGALTLVSRTPENTAGDRVSEEPAVSADGRFVAFLSYASDLVAGQDLNDGPDYFLYDRAAGTTSLLSHVPSAETTAGEPGSPRFDLGPRLSADGSWVTFASPSPDLAPADLDGVEDVFLHAGPVGRDFFTIAPCRVLDTREQGPVLTSGVERTVAVGGSCGLPASARAIAVNATVVQPGGAGHLTLHPGDLASPLASAVHFPAGATRSSSAVLALAFDGTGTLAITPSVDGGGTVHVVLDVSGYFE